MFEVAESVTIRRPVEQLFDIAADPETQLKWDPGTLQRVEKLTQGPLGVGALYRGSFKRFGTVEYEYVQYEPGRRFSHDADMRAMGHVHHTFEFEPVADGTGLTQRMQVEPSGVGRVMSPLMKPLLRRRMRVIDAELKEYAESPH
jgi:uncharacterized protein YndB with AHSA1/START domain